MIVTLLRPAVLGLFALAVALAILLAGTARLGGPPPNLLAEEAPPPIPASSFALHAARSNEATGSPLGGWRVR